MIYIERQGRVKMLDYVTIHAETWVWAFFISLLEYLYLLLDILFFWYLGIYYT